METKNKQCPLCKATALCVYEGMVGYIEDSHFDIYECTVCCANFVDPLLSNETMYNNIYRQAKLISGYTRYDRFTELVTKVRNPLNVLANLEATYWAVREALLKNFGEHKKSISILEIGSGLGYLTYSLNKAGYTTLGLDLSLEATEKAKNKYGDFYEKGDLFIVAKERTSLYDCIIMTELLEHVENPQGFIEAALKMLKPLGKLIITTPNKDASQKGIVWQSDAPPVHLWWFSEKSIRMLVSSFGKTCEFLDFLPYTKKFFSYDVNCSIDKMQESLPRLLRNGDVVLERAHHSMKSKLLGVRLHSFLAYIKLRMGHKTHSSRCASMCVIITN